MSDLDIEPSAPTVAWAALFVVATMVTASVAAWFAIAVDKRRAEQRRWRIAERTLHLLELAGGWPGAMAARRRFRHKTRKLSYWLVSTLCAITHVAAVVLVLWIAVRGAL